MNTAVPFTVLSLFASLLPGLCLADEPKPFEPATPYAVKTIRDVAYYEGDGADPVKHKLDLYLPKDCKDYPVLFFVHGGAWVHGDKGQFGMYSMLGNYYAKHGIGTVVINYRLSPGVKHPEHIKDVARAFAWTHAHIAQYGGRPDQIFAGGHSAGGHLVALLATDETYLKDMGLTSKDIRGVIAISGVYLIPERLFRSVFGSDVEERKQAEPVTHVHEGLPPFLILYADGDLPQLDSMAREFAKALKAKKVPTQLCEMKKQNHVSILFCACLEDNPCWMAIRDFIASNTKS